MEMVSEDEDYDSLAGVADYGSDPASSAEYQRRLWGAEPGRRDDLLPFFVWSIVHDHSRSEVGLAAFLEVRFGSPAPLLSSSARIGGRGRSLGVGSHGSQPWCKLGHITLFRAFWRLDIQHPCSSRLGEVVGTRLLFADVRDMRPSTTLSPLETMNSVCLLSRATLLQGYR